MSQRVLIDIDLTLNNYYRYRTLVDYYLRYKLLRVRTKELFFGLFPTNYGETFIILISVFPHRHINLLYSERFVRLCMFIACLVKFHHGIIANTYMRCIHKHLYYPYFFPNA